MSNFIFSKVPGFYCAILLTLSQALFEAFSIDFKNRFFPEQLSVAVFMNVNRTFNKGGPNFLK